MTERGEGIVNQKGSEGKYSSLVEKILKMRGEKMPWVKSSRAKAFIYAMLERNFTTSQIARALDGEGFVLKRGGKITPGTLSANFSRIFNSPKNTDYIKVTYEPFYSKLTDEEKEDIERKLNIHQAKQAAKKREKKGGSSKRGRVNLEFAKKKLKLIEKSKPISAFPKERQEIIEDILEAIKHSVESGEHAPNEYMRKALSTSPFIITTGKKSVSEKRVYDLAPFLEISINTNTEDAAWKYTVMNEAAKMLGEIAPLKKVPSKVSADDVIRVRLFIPITGYNTGGESSLTIVEGYRKVK